MRFWEKNFLYTLSLFTFLIFACVFVITVASFSNALASERNTAIREEYTLSLAIQKDISDLNSAKDIRLLPSVIAEYGTYYRPKGIFLSLAANSSLLYSNLPLYPGEGGNADSRICKTISAGSAKYICIFDTLGSGENKYPFVYMKSISALYKSLLNQSYILFFMGAAVSGVFALALYFTLKRIYRPVGNLAHELRTPLTAIRGYAEYIQSAAASEEDRYSAAEYIIGESKRLSEICEKLLVMANLREGDIPFENVDVQSLFSNAKMTYKNVEYDVKTQFIKGNKALLQSLVNNLVSNALKASAPGDTVRLRCYDNMIEVIDRGKGMSEELLAQISKRNYDAPAANKSGSGLGLPLCFNIARVHSAQINFSSELGKGTTVRVIFTSS